MKMKWTDEDEIRCFFIFKKLENEGFPKGKPKQSEYCRKMANHIQGVPPVRSLIAKIGNYKSVAGVNNPSNASKNTKRIYEQYKKYSIEELKEEFPFLVALDKIL